MSKIAWIYPGQGAQISGMGADFYKNSPAAEHLYEDASRLLGIDMKALCFQPNEQLDLTEYTQAAMVTTCLAMTRVLREEGLFPDMTAGLSLGEYAAIAAAGGMEELDAIRLVRTRGMLMQHTVPAGEGAMCAILGMEADEIQKLLDPILDVTIANYNCPGQIVITGRAKAVEEAGEKLKAAGARRVIPLSVSGPFHSPLLKPAGEILRKELERISIKELQIPYVTNVTAEIITDSGKTKELLAAQVSAPVRWMQSMEEMIRNGVDTFVEIGPGKTLSGFLRKIDRSVKVYSVSDWGDVEKVKAGLADRK